MEELNAGRGDPNLVHRLLEDLDRAEQLLMKSLEGLPKEWIEAAQHAAGAAEVPEPGSPQPALMSTRELVPPEPTETPKAVKQQQQEEQAKEQAAAPVSGSAVSVAAKPAGPAEGAASATASAEVSQVLSLLMEADKPPGAAAVAAAAAKPVGASTESLGRGSSSSRPKVKLVLRGPLAGSAMSKISSPTGKETPLPSPLEAEPGELSESHILGMASRI